MELIFERSRAGRGCAVLPPCDVPVVELPQELRREEALHLPEVAEVDLCRAFMMKRYSTDRFASGV